MTDVVTTRFRRAIDHLRRMEGVYSNHKADRGRETVYGISRRFWPGWTGWTLVDALALDLKDRKHFEAEISVAIERNPEIWRRAEDFYLVVFWVPLRCDKFAAEKVSSMLFAFGVNAGMVTAVKALQTALNGLGRPISCDGKVGPATLAAANAVEEGRLLTAYEAEILRHYRDIVRSDPSQAAFLDGWQNRVRASKGAA